MRSVAKASPVHCAMLANELDTEIPAKPRRSISRAISSVARRCPGVAIRFKAGRGEGMTVFRSDGVGAQARPDSTRLHKTRVPAKAGTHLSAPEPVEGWVPAFAGTRF